MKNRIATIARYTILEAVRTRLPLLIIVVIVTLIAASFFIREIAITENTRFQTAFYAAAIRFAAVLIAALYAISSVIREFQDKGLEATLALDLPRAHYILGKLAGFLAIAVMLALAASLPLIPLAGWQSVAQWATSLAFELAVIVGLSLLSAVTFSHLMPAFSFVVAFYVLARMLTTIRLIGSSPIFDDISLSHRIMTGLVEALALLIPGFEAWTRTSWLVDQTGSWPEVIVIAGQSTLFVAILASATVFDLYRKNL